MKLTPDDLREAIEYTAEQTGFSARLIEKDYYCSLILKSLYENELLAKHLLFKGGTLLAKAYCDFFRLSEDLDFSVTNDMCVTRQIRRKFSDNLRAQIEKAISTLNLRAASAFKGANESRQYTAVFQYNSVIGPPETVKFDLGLRNDVLDNINSVELKTLLLEPFGGKEIFPRFQAAALTIEEAYAEKTRAALTRKEPAIRDFFDLWVAQEMGLLPLTSRYFEFLSMKLAMDRTAHIDMSFSKEKYLLAQIENELNTVLKKETANRFKFNEAWQLVKTIHATLTS